MSKHCEPVDPEQIIGYGIRVIPDRAVLDGVLESVFDSVAVGMSDAEIRAALKEVLGRYSTYTVRWDAKHTVAGVKAESEEEAIKNALQMADDSFHCNENYTAVIEEG